MGISCPCYSILLREKVTCLTSDCDKARNVSKLPAFSAIESGRIILPLTPERGIHIMPPVNTTRFTLRGYSSAGRALAWHARGQRFDPAILHQKCTVLRMKYSAFLFSRPNFFWGDVLSRLHAFWAFAENRDVPSDKRVCLITKETAVQQAAAQRSLLLF